MTGRIGSIAGRRRRATWWRVGGTLYAKLLVHRGARMPGRKRPRPTSRPPSQGQGSAPGGRAAAGDRMVLRSTRRPDEMP